MLVSDLLSTRNAEELIAALNYRIRHCEEAIKRANAGLIDQRVEEEIAFWKEKQAVSEDLQDTLRRLVNSRHMRSLIAEASRNGGNAGL